MKDRLELNPNADALLSNITAIISKRAVNF